MTKLIPAVDPYWTNNEWDDVWDEAEPPPPPRRRHGLAAKLGRLTLGLALCASVAYLGLAAYSVHAIIDALDASNDEALAPFLATPLIQLNLHRDLAPRLQPTYGSSRSYLNRLENTIAESWQTPAAIRAVIQHRVLLSGFDATDRVADHVARINITGPASLSVDFTGGTIGDAALRLCIAFSPTQAPWWQIHHIAWQATSDC